MLTKKQSGYAMPLPQTIDEGGLNCKNCYYFQEDKCGSSKRCQIVKGCIDKDATCNLWTRKGKLTFEFLSGKDALALLKTRKISKIEAGYTDARHTMHIRPTTPQKGVRCDSCINFIRIDNKDIGECKGVAGDINKNACCNLWTDTKDSKVDYASGKDTKAILGDIEDIM